MADVVSDHRRDGAPAASPAQPARSDAAGPNPPARWLLDALARRGLRYHNGWPPAHHQLTERDLPCEPDEIEERERVPVSMSHTQFGLDLFASLRWHYPRDDALVAHDLYVYFDGPAPTRANAERLSPDVMVALGVPEPTTELRSFAVWEQGKPPDFVLEILSRATWRRDLAQKPRQYARMGVRECFLLDPVDHVQPRLRAWRFRPGTGHLGAALPVVPVMDGLVGIHSEVLGLALCHSEPWPKEVLRRAQVRWYDPAADRLLEMRGDAQRDAAAARRLAADAEQRLDDAEKRLDSAEKRAHDAERRADDAEQRAADAEQRAAIDRQRLAALQARLREGR